MPGCWLLFCLPLLAADAGQTDAPIRETKIAIGADQSLSPVYCLLAQGGDYRPLPADSVRRVLLIGGIDGKESSAQLLADAWRQWLDISPNHAGFELAAISVKPEAEKGLQGGFPPAVQAYATSQRPVANYLWRWIGVFSPDLVVEVCSGQQSQVHVPAGQLSAPLRALFPDAQKPNADDLIAALAEHRPADVGSVPALRVTVAESDQQKWLPQLLARLESGSGLELSPARREMQSRLQRSPLQVAAQLAKVYGHELDSVSYIPALSLMGRLRLADVTGTKETLADVERIVAPYVNATKSSLGEKPNGSVLAGHLVFADLADRTKNGRYVELVQSAADFAFDEQGRPKEAMPFHTEMSDAVFMSCPILAKAGKLTDQKRYFDMCVRHFAFMKRLTMRSDNIYRHSPLDEAAWGRGNGFPALGLALTLTDLPKEHPGYADILQAYRDHMRAMAGQQDVTGHWRQVVDHPASYRELTSTCMITFAMARGIRMGWLDADQYLKQVKRGWTAISGRVAADGGLVDVCTGTGKQQSLRDYFDRTAILGRDGRGGAMAMQAALEVAELEKYLAASNE